jgi:hypothetical protein
VTLAIQLRLLATYINLCTTATERNCRPGVVLLGFIHGYELAAVIVGAIDAEEAGGIELLGSGLIDFDYLRGEKVFDQALGKLRAVLGWEGFEIIDCGVVRIYNAGTAQEVKFTGRETLVMREVIVADAAVIRDGVLR